MKLLVPATIMAIICGLIGLAFRRVEEKPAGFEADSNDLLNDEYSGLQTWNVSYEVEGVACRGYFAAKHHREEKCPLIIIVPEWWGITNFTKSKARQLASLGYCAFVADVYGNRKVAADPGEAKNLAEPFYQNPERAIKNIAASRKAAESFPGADGERTAIIGYCFGGSMALNFALTGEPVKAVVSFHSGLKIVPPQKEIHAAVLVCHGDNDIFVPRETVMSFKQQLNHAGVNYQFITYPNATHSFTNPEADEYCRKFAMPIAYNEEADKASWAQMLSFFESIFHV